MSKSELERLKLEFQALLRKERKSKQDLEELDQLGLTLQAAYREETRDLLKELRSIGYNVVSVWDLVNARYNYPEAVPLLIKHLSNNYDIKNKEGIVRALAVREARGVACERVLNEYNTTSVEYHTYRWVCGNTMSVIMTNEYVEDVISIVKDEKNGNSRQMFISALKVSNTEEVRQVLVSLVSDKSEVISNHAEKVLKVLERRAKPGKPQ